MPRTSRKRARSDAETGRPSHRRSRHDDDESAEDGGAANSMDVDGDGDGDDAQAQGSQRQRAWKLPAGYDDSNRAFLQALMAHGSLTFSQAQQVLAPILSVKKAAAAAEASGQSLSQSTEEYVQPDDVTDDVLRQYISQAKAALAPLDFDIRSATNERSIYGSNRNGTSADDHRVWVLVSTDTDPKSHLAVLFTPRKLAFLHRLLDTIFDTFNTPRIEALCITQQQAIKLSRPPRTERADVAEGADVADVAAAQRDKGLKHSVVISLLGSLVRQGWLAKSAQGFYALTTRALLELEPFLVERYNETEAADANTWQRIKYCAACRELITTGLRCATPTCTLRLHDHCEEAFWRTQHGRGGGGERHRCPKCDAPWGKAEDANGEVEGKLYFLGERAITSTDIYRSKRGPASGRVDEVMRYLGGGSGRRHGRDSEVAEPFRRAAAQRHSNGGDADGDAGGGDDDDDEV